MKNHTAAPWHHGKASDEILTREGTPICDLSVSRDHMADQMADANGCLLAMAPELLALLEELPIDKGQDGRRHSGYDIPVSADLLNRIRAAIKKARGE